MKPLCILAIVLDLAIARAQPAPPTEPTTPDVSTVERAKALYAAGSKHYDLHEYDKAVLAFRAAYDLYPEPLFLFNIAQAYRQLGDCKNARGFYQTYLQKLPAADNRDKVEEFITKMDDCVRHQETAEAERKKLPPVVVGEPPRNDRTLRGVGIITAVAGAAIAGVGIYFSNQAAGYARDAETFCAQGCDSSEITEIDRKGREADRTALVFYGIGGVAIATGAGLLLYTALHADPDRVTVVPTRGGATMTKTWRF